MTGQGLPILSGRKVCKALFKYGFEPHRQKRSHIILKNRSHPDGTLTVIVPNHKEVEIGTLDEIIKQAELTHEEFLELL